MVCFLQFLFHFVLFSSALFSFVQFCFIFLCSISFRFVSPSRSGRGRGHSRRFSRRRRDLGSVRRQPGPQPAPGQEPARGTSRRRSASSGLALRPAAGPGPRLPGPGRAAGPGRRWPPPRALRRHGPRLAELPGGPRPYWPARDPRGRRGRGGAGGRGASDGAGWDGGGGGGRLWPGGRQLAGSSSHVPATAVPAGSPGASLGLKGGGKPAGRRSGAEPMADPALAASMLRDLPP